jgi:hypothetical protein
MARWRTWHLRSTLHRVRPHSARKLCVDQMLLQRNAEVYGCCSCSLEQFRLHKRIQSGRIRYY